VVKTITIVSLSSGVLGEAFVKHEVDIGLHRLHAYGVHVKFSEHALKGMDYLKAHPEARAADLLQAFRDPETDMILCAIGGDDTYRLLPCLFDHDELRKSVTNKIFLGFSDTTMNHLMLHKVGIRSFYGQAFLPDLCELDSQMLPYTREYFEELLETGMIREIHPSNVWYQSRSDFSTEAVGTGMKSFENEGFELLQGSGTFSGEILGGCIDTIYDIFNAERYEDSVSLCRKYHLFPSLEDWRGKILLLESSEEQPAPEKYCRMLEALKQTGIFHVLSGVLIGKPMDEKYFGEYKKTLIRVIDDPALPIVCNINVGHATPRCIIPFGVEARVDADRQVIRFSE
jgi:muramoyltetrapeptide carboxypeptidase LdcA involved in peptidoglycan recycling